jgi:hypothetical protein
VAEFRRTWVPMSGIAERTSRGIDRRPARDPGRSEGLGHGQLPSDLLCPYEADAMKMGPVNQKVGNVRNNGPEMLNSA